LAVVLLLFQVVLSADHLGASAAAAFGPNQTDEALGILSLCHADGSTGLADPSDGDVPATAPAQPCVLCATVALAGAGLTPAPPVAANPALVVLAENSRPAVATVTVRTPLRYGTERGPPIPVV
jgi:hypothetical protein